MTYEAETMASLQRGTHDMIDDPNDSCGSHVL